MPSVDSNPTVSASVTARLSEPNEPGPRLRAIAADAAKLAVRHLAVDEISVEDRSGVALFHYSSLAWPGEESGRERKPLTTLDSENRRIIWRNFDQSNWSADGNVAQACFGDEPMTVAYPNRLK